MWFRIKGRLNKTNFNGADLYQELEQRAVIKSEKAMEHKRFMCKIDHSTLSAMTWFQKGFVLSVRSIPSDVNGNQLIAYVSEMFPPAHLFAPEMNDMPILWIELLKFLNNRGAFLEQHSSGRVIMTLATGLYQESEEKKAAIQIASTIVANGRKLDPFYVRWLQHAVPEANG